jgi:hypothetical protein
LVPGKTFFGPVLVPVSSCESTVLDPGATDKPSRAAAPSKTDDDSLLGCPRFKATVLY